MRQFKDPSMKTENIENALNRGNWMKDIGYIDNERAEKPNRV